MTRFLHHFFIPSGRIGRKTWWLRQIALVPLAFALSAVYVAGIVLADILGSPSVFLVSLAVSLAVFIWCRFAINTKRFHDHGFSAWWNLLTFIPIIGCFTELVMLGIIAGDDITNKYGDGEDVDAKVVVQTSSSVPRNEDD